MTEGGDQGRQSGGWGQPGDQYGDQGQQQAFPPAPAPPWSDHTGQQSGHQSGQQPAAAPSWDQPGQQQSYGEQQQSYGEQQQPSYGQQPAYGQDPNYGQQQPYGQQAPAYDEQQAYGSPWGSPPPGYGGGARTDYASWGARAGALILDGIFATLLFIPTLIVAIAIAATADTVTNADGTTEVTDANGGLIALAILLGLAAVVVAFWNQGWRQGSKGQSWGKQIVGIKLVKESTGQPPGGGLGLGRLLLRQVLGVVPFFFLVDYLFPLWDEKHQTLTDKIVSTLVVRAR